MSFTFITLLGFIIDVLFGWPNWLYRMIKHPVVWIGTHIDFLERRLNRGAARQKRFNGMMCVLMVVIGWSLPAIILQFTVEDNVLGWIIIAILVWPFMATRAMFDHVLAVWQPLAASDLPAARRAVAMIVGRDPNKLNRAGVTRAAIESLAENTSDGIVAPVFWALIAGLPGVVAYKAINTLDSMIGHKNEQYEDFGRFAAKLDDVVNLIPARITGVLFALASGRRFFQALAAMLRDARKHRSPNAGWPEAAMAGALGCRLSGPRLYGATRAAEPWLNEQAPDPEPHDLEAALRLFQRAMGLMGLALVIILYFNLD